MSTVESKNQELDAVVAAAKARDRSAFDRLIALTQESAMRCALGILRDNHEAAEALQQAYLQAWTHLPRLENPAFFKTWFFRIVVNQSLTQRRSLKARPVISGLNAAISDPSASPADLAAAADLRQVIASAMRRLSKRQATALTLFGFEDFSQDQVAAIMKCSVVAARNHLFRARAKMKVFLKDYL